MPTAAICSLADARAAVPAAELVQTRTWRLRVRVTGAGPDLVLIHGVTDNGSSWDEVVPALAAEARVHAIDLPGHGLSDIPSRPLRVEEMAAAVGDYLDAAGVGPCVVAGNSLGGGVALMLAAREPERVRAAVSICSLGLPFPMPAGLGMLRLPGVASLMPAVSFRRRLRRTIMRDTFHRGFVPSEAAMERYWEGWRVLGRPPYVRDLLRALDRAEPAPVLAGLRMPVHVVHGDEDRVIPVRVGREIAAAIPGARLTVLPRIGHEPQLEAPAATIAVLRDALAALR
ncbi:MAG: alpha/beta fold hydrolase [bacterium]|nr:alpha/beta fold hydrolase [bacterium]